MLSFRAPARALIDATSCRPPEPLKTWGKRYKIPIKSGPYRARIAKAIFKSRPLHQQQAIIRRAKWRWSLVRSAVAIGFDRAVLLVAMVQCYKPAEFLDQLLADRWMAQGVLFPDPRGRHCAAPAAAVPSALDAPPSPPAKAKRVSWGPVHVREYVVPA